MKDYSLQDSEMCTLAFFLVFFLLWACDFSFWCVRLYFGGGLVKLSHIQVVLD